MTWVATTDDIDWLLTLAKDCYPRFDVDSSEKWLRAYCGKPGIIIVRGDHSAGLAVTHAPFWLGGEKECELQFVCSRQTRFGAVELLANLRHINELRKQQGCARMFINSRLADLEPFAKKLGARLIGKSYVLED